MQGAILRANGPATRTQALPIAALEPTPLKVAQAAALACGVHLAGPPDVNLERASEALGTPRERLRVVGLDKPRQHALIQRLRATGAGNELERMLAAA